MTINRNMLPLPCNTTKEWKICIEGWKFFKNPSISSLQHELTDGTRDIFFDLYKTALIIQGRNAALDDDINFITSQLTKQCHTIPCHSGCSDCCKQAIAATPFEAALIGLYLMKHSTICDTFLVNYTHWDAETKNVRDNFVDWAQQFYSTNIDDGRFRYTDFRAPCPFLVNDLCLIYPVRPYCCRSYLAMSDCCQHPENPDERPGFKGIDVGSYTDFKKNNGVLMDLLFDQFKICKNKTKVRLLPDLVHKFLIEDVDKFLIYCSSSD